MVVGGDDEQIEIVNKISWCISSNVTNCYMVCKSEVMMTMSLLIWWLVVMMNRSKLSTRFLGA
jgi:hypothetical protein